MGSFSAVRLLGVPVLLDEQLLGRAVDLLLDADRGRLLGFVVESGAGSQRFLPYGAAQHADGEITVQSALMLLDDVGFYRKRGVSFRSVLGDPVEGGGGRLADMHIGQGGEVVEIQLDRTATAA